MTSRWNKTIKELLKFSDFKIKKMKFHLSKKVIHVRITDIKKTLIAMSLSMIKSKELDVKYFIRYENNLKMIDHYLSSWYS